MLVAAMLAASARVTHAQFIDVPRVEIGVLPAGATFFTSGDSGAPSFDTYALAGSVTVKANRFVGVEAEVGGYLGIGLKDDAPAFFGNDETRYGHRIVGGILINVAR